MQCEYCEIVDRKGKAQLLYEDDLVVAAIRDNVVIPGQITVFPKEHCTILELIAPAALTRCSEVVNAVSIACFESFAAQGTNIISRNGLGAGQNVPHFCFEVIPRKENDGLNFIWQPKQFMEDEMETTLRSIQEEFTKPEKTKSEQQDTAVQSQASSTKSSKTEIKSTENKDNYLLRSLRRRP